MSRNNRIVWTTREREELINAAVRILRSYPKMPVFRAVGEAQDIKLPPERRRRWLTSATLGGMTQEIQRRLNTLVEHRVDTNQYVEVAPSDDAIAAAARSVAEKFETQLRAALAQSTAKIVKQAAEGKL